MIKDKLNQLAKGKKGIFIMSLISFTESIVFIIPPDPFLALLCIKNKYKNVIKNILICTFFSVLGGSLAYYFGEILINYALKKNIDFIVKNLDSIEKLKISINDETFLIMLTSAFTPLPYKIFCITAGVMKVNFIPFLLGSIIGRGLRFYIFGILAFKFGDKFYKITNSKKFKILMISLILILIIYLYYKWI